MFNAHNLSVLAYANGFTQWHYITDDDVLVDGYFDIQQQIDYQGAVPPLGAKYNRFRQGDVIIYNSAGSVIMVAVSFADKERAAVTPMLSANI